VARMLVIDDDDEIRLLVKEILARAGYEVFEASNGTLGLAIVEQKRPDVVITDILMPEMDGVETIINIRCYCPEAKIIAISGGSESSDASLCLRVGETAGASILLRSPSVVRYCLRLSINSLRVDWCSHHSWIRHGAPLGKFQRNTILQEQKWPEFS
jgi:CheY-like chemotaxis protein